MLLAAYLGCLLADCLSPPTIAHQLSPACHWPPAIGHLLLASCCWPPTDGGLLLAADSWTGTTGLVLVAAHWPPACCRCGINPPALRPSSGEILWRPKPALTRPAASARACAVDAPGALARGPQVTRSVLRGVEAWERAASRGERLRSFGARATALLERTLGDFDRKAEEPRARARAREERRRTGRRASGGCGIARDGGLCSGSCRARLPVRFGGMWRVARCAREARHPERLACHTAAARSGGGPPWHSGLGGPLGSSWASCQPQASGSRRPVARG